MNRDEFHQFLSAFRETSSVPNTEVPATLAVSTDFRNCIAALGGRTFEGGLYRVFTGHDITRSTRRMENVFPDYRGRITAFACDWLGRHFVVDNSTMQGGEPCILLMEPGAGEVMEIPLSIVPFHNEELPACADDALARPFYLSWRAGHTAEVTAEQCVGYRVPLFLGGKDDVDNLEVSDLEVYCHLCAELAAKVRDLPDGASIRDIKIG